MEGHQPSFLPPSEQEEEGSSFLDSNFPREHAYQRMASDGDMGPEGFDIVSSAQESSSTPTDFNYTRSTQASATSITSQTAYEGGYGMGPVMPEQAVSRSYGHDTEPAIIGTEADPALQRPRPSRFVEILQRKFSKERSQPRRDDDLEFDAAKDAASYGGQSFPMSSPKRPQDPSVLSPITEYGDDRFNDGTGNLSPKYKKAPVPDCHSRQDVHIRRRSWFYVTLLTMSIYSTFISGLWLVVAILQPRYGRHISTANEPGVIQPTTASTVTALLAKTCELSFVTVFVACLGQILTHRAFITRSTGMTVAEMTMRNWILQPGSMFTRWQGIPYAAGTILGFLTLLASLSATLYTTASDAMITPILKFGDWESKQLQGVVEASYSNVYFVEDTCTSVDGFDPYSSTSCLAVQYSGQSYRNLLAFMSLWNQTGNDTNSTLTSMQNRPVGSSTLYDNSTLYTSWIGANESNTADNFQTYNRIVNNVTLAMPHPGVYSAAIDPTNGILQPSDLQGVGEYQIRASVVSPSVSVMCVNMDKDELAPLIYTTWPNAVTNGTGIPGQTIGYADWESQVPAPNASYNELNKTVVDDIFQWGEKWSRRPPVFQLYPSDYNMITNTTVYLSDSLYLLGKSAYTSNFTLCQLRSWVSPNCNSQFNISGISGSKMKANCDDPADPDTYQKSVPNAVVTPSTDWKNMADEWRLALDLDGGVQNNNASNARLLTNLALLEPQLNTSLPSMAEALAVLASSTIVTGSLSTTYKHYWGYNETILNPGVYEKFNATIRTQQYTSSHTDKWQNVFYIILGLVFAINIVCILYLLVFCEAITDFTEPQNMFALAINSPWSRQLQGSCGGGPKSRDLVVPYRIAYEGSANHYFFEEASDRPYRGRYSHQSTASGANLLANGRYSNSYKRLSNPSSWL